MTYKLKIDLEYPGIYSFELYVQKKFLFFKYWSHIITKLSFEPTYWTIDSLLEVKREYDQQHKEFKEKKKQFPKIWIR